MRRKRGGRGEGKWERQDRRGGNLRVGKRIHLLLHLSIVRAVYRRESIERIC